MCGFFVQWPINTYDYLSNYNCDWVDESFVFKEQK